MSLSKRSFFKSLALVATGILTPKLTAAEIDEVKTAVDMPMSALRPGGRAYVTTVKGDDVVVKHGLGSTQLFVQAANHKQPIFPMVDPIDRDSCRLRFSTPGFFSFIKPRGVYRVVILAYGPAMITQPQKPNWPAQRLSPSWMDSP